MNFLDIIAERLDLDMDYVEGIVKKSQFCYRTFSIPKRSGGRRTIYQPSPELKTLQYWLVYNIFSEFPVSSSACAYCRGKSILDAARVHMANDHILHMDIKNFFESITGAHLQKVLKNPPDSLDSSTFDLKDDEVLDCIKRICLYKGHLTIGAVSSPILSNIIFYEIDLKIEKYCSDKGYVYTRYADDIYISSKMFLPEDVREYVSGILKQANFDVNTKKTRFMSKGNRRVITGLTLTTSQRLSIGNSRKRVLKKELYTALKSLSSINEKDRLRLKGYLSFLKNVDPFYCNKLINKYAKYGDIKELL